MPVETRYFITNRHIFGISFLTGFIIIYFFFASRVLVHGHIFISIRHFFSTATSYCPSVQHKVFLLCFSCLNLTQFLRLASFPPSVLLAVIVPLPAILSSQPFDILGSVFACSISSAQGQRFASCLHSISLGLFPDPAPVLHLFRSSKRRFFPPPTFASLSFYHPMISSLSFNHVSTACSGFSISCSPHLASLPR